ncbi:N-acetyltransferase family protein [Microbacterium gorillae]|uniref:GNAT family N-acetyltransferase n=1 Tax=Microbacterium gorillae TaxID=1231063 RepID=UPI003D95C103
MTTITLRPAVADDHAAITALFLRCFRESYRGILADETIAAMTDERAAALWRRVLDAAEGASLVAVRDASVVGVTRWSAGDVHSLYVDPDIHGAGIGSMLLDAAVARIAEAGFERAHLWVFADNAPSVAFYRSRGWVPTGTTRVEEEFGSTEQQMEKVIG